MIPRKYVVILIIVGSLFGIYVLSLGIIRGNYFCPVYEYLDGGYSKTWINFKDGVVTLYEKVPGVPISGKIIAKYDVVGYGEIRVTHIDSPMAFTLKAGLFGLWMNNTDAMKTNIRFPEIGNIWCWRILW